MNSFEAAKIRNIVFVGHGGSGKSTIAEAFLFQSGLIGRLGRTDAGTLMSDSDPDEIARKISIGTSFLPVVQNDVKLNILDAPGFADFVGEVTGALKAAETAVIVVDAVSGVQVDTQRYWRMADAADVSKVIVISKMDKETAKFDDAFNSVRKRFGNNVAVVYLPIGEGNDFKGVVDIVKMKAYLDSEGIDKPKEADIPQDMADTVEEHRMFLMEAVAGVNDNLMEKYLENGELTSEEMESGLAEAIKQKALYPVIATAAHKNIGIYPLMDFLAKYCPSPLDAPAVDAKKGSEEIELSCDANGPTVAYVFRTTADQFAGRINYLRVYSGSVKSASDLINVSRSTKEHLGNLFVMYGKQQDPQQSAVAGDIVLIAKLHDTKTGETLAQANSDIEVVPSSYPEPMLNFSITTVAKGEEDKLAQGMHRFTDEDQTLRFEQDPETHEAIIAGMGELHLEVTRDRLKRKFNVDTVLGNPTVAYRETIKMTAEGHGRHKKQSGGAGQFGDAKIRLKPAERGEGFEFIDEVVGGSVPRQFIPSVEKGVREALKHGVLAGYPVIDVKVALFDGSYHPVDSKDIAFQMAGRMAFQDAMQNANPIILEPFMDVEVIINDDQIGDVIASISGKRGRVQGSDSVGGGNSVVRAQVPQAEMFQYSNELRALSQGRGSFTMHISHYEEVPHSEAEKIIASSTKKRITE